MNASLPKIICLMGPTAVGKTALALQLVQQFPCDIISVDSAMVYRGMDIGTAKPNEEIKRIAPHRLIDIVEPNEIYSAGLFRKDALREIENIIAQGRVPLLVGGTMLYFRILQQGIANLPKANVAIRSELQEKANVIGWELLHAELKQIDPHAANHIHQNDSQRIQRALEVFYVTGKPISYWQKNATFPLQHYNVKYLALMPTDRVVLHNNIALRFQQMLQAGFVDEVKTLYARGDLTPDLPSIRSVGYRQVWQYLLNEISYEEMCNHAIVATRQLAKRQMTWIRSWQNILVFENEKELMGEVMEWMDVSGCGKN